MLLSFASYASPFNFTYKQVEELGGFVQSGSKGFRIIYWRILEHVSPQGELTEIPLLKYYVVFNLEQVRGLPQAQTPHGGVEGRAVYGDRFFHRPHPFKIDNRIAHSPCKVNGKIKGSERQVRTPHIGPGSADCRRRSIGVDSPSGFSV